MKSTINKILEDIDNKKKDLLAEYDKLRKKYNFEYIKWKIRFTREQNEENKKRKKSIWKTIFSSTIREILSIPFIYGFIVPAVILDISIFIYQNTAIRLYGIPLAKRSDYITFDRRHLSYLNWIEKINCLYCSYVNWLFAYVTEVAWRTEKYWCPIKHAKKMKWWHSMQKYFADYWDADGFRESFSQGEKFFKEKQEKWEL